MGRGDIRPAPGWALRPTSGLDGRSTSRRAGRDTSTGASVRIDGEAADVAHAMRGPLGATLPSDQPSAGQRAGLGSGSRSRRSITRWLRLRRCVAITTTVDVSEVDDAGARWRRPCGARLRRALRKRWMLRLESGDEWTIHATAAMTTSHNPTASRLTTKPLIGPPPFRSWGILADRSWRMHLLKAGE